MSTSLSQQWSEALESFADYGDTPWLQTLVKEERNRFATMGLPSQRDEDWKYTGLKPLERSGAELLSQASNDQPLQRAYGDIKADTHCLMHQGGLVQVENTPTNGVQLLTLEQAITDHQPMMQQLLESLGSVFPADGFTVLNSALLAPENTLLVYVPAGVDGGRLAIHWLATESAQAVLANSRLCVVLEENASLELVELYDDAESVSHHNLVTQIRLAESAGLQHVRLQQLHSKRHLITRADIDQQASSHYQYFGFDFGGGLVRHGLNNRLLGKSAKCELHGAYILDGRQHVDNHLKIYHESGDCKSKQFFRGVAGGRGRAVFNGKVVVAEGADDSEANQSNANLLLSEHAEIDTKPELEIYADEVVASHGATVGQLDESAVFYLRCRGLDEATARAMLTSAFCHEVVDAIPADDLREQVGASLDQQMSSQKTRIPNTGEQP